ncbi:MAG: hypothetical protein AB7F86_12960 [Bdellovibrionales bacterium]
MKKVIGLFAVAMLLPIGFAKAEVTSKQVTLGVSEVYIPGGFGPETDAFVVVSGMFPNSCYRWSHAEVTDVGANVHEIRSMARVSETMCLMVLVPYSKEVRLGQMNSGEHTLRFISGDGTYFERTMVIE